MNPKRVRAIYWVLLAVIPLTFTSCITTRHLPEGSLLLKKNTVVVKSSEHLNKISKNLEQNYTLETKMATLAKQQPNRKTLGLVKFNLWVYDKFYTTKDSGFQHYLITNLGEPPVLFDSTTLNSSALIMKGFLIGKGYLNADVGYEYKLKPKWAVTKKKAIAIFNVNTGPLYTLDTIYFPQDTSILNAVVVAGQHQTLLKHGDAFDADVIEKEQLRILRQFQDAGYFNFRREYIYFLADTQSATHLVNLYVKVEKDNDTASAQKKYTIRNIYLYSDFSPQYELVDVKFDTTFVDGLYFLSSKKFLDPHVLATAVFMQPGGYYSRQSHDCTLNRISDLAVYKFANVRFDELPNRELNCFIYLQPAKKYQTSAELLVGNIEDNFASGLKLSFGSKNIYKRANRLDMSLTGGIQIPVFPKVNVDSLFYNVVGQINYTLPRFAFLHTRISCYNNPLTKISLQASYYQQTNYYTLANYGISYSMEWKEVQFPLKKIIFPILGINYVYPTTTPLFDVRLEQDPYLKESFSKQFITSLGAAYIYSNQQIGRPVNFTYFAINGEVAGNVLYAISNSNIVHFKVDSATGGYSLFGVNFAQYIRTEIDLRHYWSISSNRTIAVRLNPGIIYPYGNSKVSPYVKQFYVGGTNSMRAWRVRSLGPGAYRDTVSTISYYSSAGDLKLEANFEYRYNIFGMLKGAAFVDAGNIWTLRKDTIYPESNFYWDQFYKQFGVDVGLGLRLDFSYFIMRLDFATKVYDPSLLTTDEDPWVIRNFCLYCDMDKDGVKEFGKAVLLQLAVGYPF